MCDYNEYFLVGPEHCVFMPKPCLTREEIGELIEQETPRREVVLGIQTHGTSWEFAREFTFNYCDGSYICEYDIKNIHGPVDPSEVDEPLAEIVIWCWNDNQQEIVKKELFKRNENKQKIFLLVEQGVYDFHFIIRLIKKRKLAEDLCAPLEFLPSSDAFTISVGEQNFVVSALRLMQISPVFRKMLTNEMREKTERKVEVKDADPEHFRAFLELIDPDQNIHSNPANVMGVLMLADRYHVNLAKERCEQHLLNCVEMSLFARFQLANACGFNKIQDWFLTIGSENLRVLYKANAEKFKNFQFSMEFMHDLTARICDNE